MRKSLFTVIDPRVESVYSTGILSLRQICLLCMILKTNLLKVYDPLGKIYLQMILEAKSVFICLQSMIP
jgi:hypothetical protein